MEVPPHLVSRQLWIIWGALSFSVIIYLVVLHFSGGEAEANSNQDSFAKILGGVAVANILISIAIRKRWTIPTVKKLTSETLMHALPSCIISWAMAESVAVFGLVLGMMGHPISTYGVFFIASFATLMFLTPNFSGLLGQDAN